MAVPEKQSRVGGKRAGAGRKPGQKNAITIEIETRAREHAGDAIAALVEVARNKESPARVAAASALLDRGYGRPKQAIEAKHSGKVEHTVRFVREGRRVTSG